MTISWAARVSNIQAFRRFAMDMKLIRETGMRQVKSGKLGINREFRRAEAERNGLDD